MIKRTVEIGTDNLVIRSMLKNLVIIQGSEEVGRVPFEDLGILILGNAQTTLTRSALASCAENGSAVLVCGRDHHPVGLMLPLAGNIVHARRLRAQIDAGLPLKKRLWQKLVQAKLENQAAVVKDDEDATRKIRSLARDVKSGDHDNREAQGARLYWPAIFKDPEFRREREGPPPNGLLNYGYAILRAAAARALCGAGLHPAIGLHHHNRENPFALADDVMEPYRPYVDVHVRELRAKGATEPDKESKAELLGLLAEPIRMGKEKGPFMVMLQKTAASLALALENDMSSLDLPSISGSAQLRRRYPSRG